MSEMRRGDVPLRLTPRFSVRLWLGSPFIILAATEGDTAHQTSMRDQHAARIALLEEHSRL
jgi:hypothetical protein